MEPSAIFIFIRELLLLRVSFDSNLNFQNAKISRKERKERKEQNTNLCDTLRSLREIIGLIARL